MSPSTADLHTTDRAGRESLPPRLVFIFAVACGITVANLYWAQPLLDTIATTFRASTAAAGLIVTFTQISYAVGLLFLVPLGDLLERKRLILTLMAVIALALAGATFAPSIHWFIAASLLIGGTSAVAQILVPFAAHLAQEWERGKVVGQVMSGLLLGILLARTLAGLISSLVSWRAVFAFAAILMAVQSLVFLKYLPRHRLGLNMSYPALLGSIWHLVRAEPTLRLRSLYGGLVFANFSILWTSLTFLLAGPHYHYSDAVIGLFGMVGAAGALSANVAGRLADRGLGNRATLCFLLLNIVAFLLMIPGEHYVLPLLAGIIILDAGVQGTHIINQSEIYRLNPEARSRITTAYMFSFFCGGAIGSAISAAVYAARGWSGVVGLGVGCSAIALLVWLVEQAVSRKRGE
jgi:predicted MFS family arabinose efflux permease